MKGMAFEIGDIFIWGSYRVANKIKRGHEVS